MSEAQNNDIQSRLQRMVEEDPYGKEAETLLHSLSAFGKDIEISEIAFLAPTEMPEDIRDHAFEALKTWQLIRLLGNYGRSWKIRDEIFPFLVPPDPDQGRHLQYDYYVSRYANSPLDDDTLYTQLAKHHENMGPSLIWGLDHDEAALGTRLK